MKTYILSLFVVLAFLLCGCTLSEQKKDHDAAAGTHGHVESEEHDHDHGKGHDHADEIAFSQEQASLAHLQTETVAAGPFQQVIKTSGRIQPAQGDEATVVATANGIASFTGASVSEGSSVRAGEALVSISAKNLPDGDPAVIAQVGYETAEKEFRRAQTLLKDQIISEKDFEQIRLRYETARNAFDAQASRVSAAGIAVTSPISGYMKSRMVGQGEYVSVGQPLAIVSQNKRLQLKAEIPEKYFSELKEIRSANFKPAYGRTVYKLSDLNGRLLSFGKASADDTPYIPVIFEFNNAGDIVPGAFAEIFLLSRSMEEVISVPVTALSEEQGLYFVYLQQHDDAYKKQEVALGLNNGERVQVVAGLKPGDKVVTHGVYQVKLAATSSIIPEGHSHNH